jgi:tRNA A-37 threonylcarbamoyl transferase component Bud32
MSTQPDFEQTLVSPNSGGITATGPRPALVEGRRPALSSAVHGVLRERLRITSLLLFFGFTAFFIRDLFGPVAFEGPVGAILFWSHASIICVAGAIAFRMCRSCKYQLKHLRLMESFLFGLPVVLFALSDFACLFCHSTIDVARPVAPKWLLLIFTYALFIPNTWRRAGWPIATFCAIPIVFVIAANAGIAAMHPVEAAAAMHSQPLELSMLMIITGVTATWGVHTINRLRTEAFEARRLGQYQLSRLLGAGGMGEVYLAEHILLKRPCAIKVIRAEQAGESQALKRFEREVRATSRLTHWNTVEIFDYGRAEDGTFYYVMEYLPGMNLDQLVEMHGPLDADRVIHLLKQTCDALQEAHAHGLIHRDIKPANIFAAHRGGIYDVVKLLDFGLARPLSARIDPGLTNEGTITGSPLFTSPEQAVGDAADERSDIYSLGVVAWWLLTGQPLFDDKNPLKILVAHATQDPGQLQDYCKTVPQDLERIIMRCLLKKPDDRFQSVEDLRNALLSCDSAAHWTQKDAVVWWRNHGCPNKKQLDAEVLAEAIG